MGAFLAVYRDCSLLCHYQDATVPEFVTRFTRYRNLDFVMVVLFIVGAILPLVLTNYVSELGGNITGNQVVDASLPAGMALLFLGDGILMISLIKHTNGWASASHSVSKLRRETIVNVTTNSVTFLAYVAFRAFIIIKSEKELNAMIGGPSGIALTALYVGFLLLKLTKIFVMAAFARYLNTRGDTTLPLRTSPVEAIAVAVAPVAALASQPTPSQHASLSQEGGQRLQPSEGGQRLKSLSQEGVQA